MTGSESPRPRRRTEGLYINWWGLGTLLPSGGRRRRRCRCRRSQSATGVDVVVVDANNLRTGIPPPRLLLVVSGGRIVLCAEPVFKKKNLPAKQSRRHVRQVAPGDIWSGVHKVIKLAELDVGNGDAMRRGSATERAAACRMLTE